MSRILLSLVIALLTLPLAPVAGAAPPPGLQCGVDPAYAEIVTLRSNSLTVQVAGQTTSLAVPTGQALVFSLDGGFWVDVDYHCIGEMRVVVLKGDQVTSDSWVGPRCATGTHSEWVPMGAETSEVSVFVQWFGCDGTSGGTRARGTAGDPPVFHPDGSLRL